MKRNISKKKLEDIRHQQIKKALVQVSRNSEGNKGIYCI